MIFFFLILFVKDPGHSRMLQTRDRWKDCSGGRQKGSKRYNVGVTGGTCTE